MRKLFKGMLNFSLENEHLPRNYSPLKTALLNISINFAAVRGTTHLPDVPLADGALDLWVSLPPPLLLEEVTPASVSFAVVVESRSSCCPSDRFNFVNFGFECSQESTTRICIKRAYTRLQTVSIAWQSLHLPHRLTMPRSTSAGICRCGVGYTQSLSVSSITWLRVEDSRSRTPRRLKSEMTCRREPWVENVVFGGSRSKVGDCNLKAQRLEAKTK